MPTAFCERAIETSLECGNALLKFVAPNDCGVTKSHQYGPYLPKPAWKLYTTIEPVKGVNGKAPVKIVWQDDRVTDSMITWYGAAKSEYRLTRFGQDFPYFTPDNVGDLLVLAIENYDVFHGFVLDLDEDIEELQAALGVQPFEHWGVYEGGAAKIETEDECLHRHFNEFVSALKKFPTGEAFSTATRQFLDECIKNFRKLSPDDALVQWVETEYRLFQVAERQICQAEIVRPFKDVDDFLRTASSITQRRKARAGRSLENHVEHLLKSAGIPHKMRPKIDGKPEVVIPSEDAYNDETYPVDQLCIIGVKRTCRDRWWQILNEGRRVEEKHILTMQPTISVDQLKQMNDRHVHLVVPEPFHKKYPKDRPMKLLSVEALIDDLRKRFAK